MNPSAWYDTPRSPTEASVRAVCVFASLMGGEMVEFVSPAYRQWIEDTSKKYKGGAYSIDLNESIKPYLRTAVEEIDGCHLLFYRILMQNRFKNL